MKFLKKVDKLVDFVVGNIAAVMLIFLILFTCLTIISRYLFNINMHGFEELPTMVFIVFVWLGTVLSARDDSMLKVPLIQDALRDGVPKLLGQLLSMLISTAALAAFLPLVWKLWIVNIERGTVSAAVGFNMWWVYGSMLVGVLGMTVYYAVNTIRCIIALVETCRGDKTAYTPLATEKKEEDDDK